MYSEYKLVGNGCLYLVVRNHGHSTAIIDDFDIDCDFTGCYKINSNKDFIAELEESLLDLGQYRTCLINYEKVKKTITFKIKYHKGNKKYEDSFQFTRQRQ